MGKPLIMDAEKHFKNIWKLPATESHSVCKILSIIFNNILLHPLEPTYKDINFSKIKNKFANCPSCLGLLYCAGFKKSTDSKRLQWEYTNNLYQDCHNNLYQDYCLFTIELGVCGYYPISCLNQFEFYGSDPVMWACFDYCEYE